MHNNQPVSQREYLFDDHATLMSTTDLNSYITYAKDAFIEASGFTNEEINGQPHNMVCHPDSRPRPLPSMWATLYQDFRTGRAKGRRFYKGLVVRSGWRRPASILKTLPLRWRIRSTLLALLPLSVAGVWVLGVTPTALSVATGSSHKVDQIDRVNEVSVTLRAIGQLGLMFRWLVDDVSGQAINVLSASDAITRSNNELSRRTEQAAANVQQTAATMNEMTATVKSNTDTAHAVNTLSSEIPAVRRSKGVT